MLKTNGIPDQPSPSFVLAGWRLRLRHRRIGTVLFSFVCLFAVGGEIVLSQTAADRHESARSDKLTGGRVEVAEFEPNQPDIRITLNVPSFRLTFWQNGKEVQSYFVGVGMKNHPIYIGDREATEVIWNPA